MAILNYPITNGEFMKKVNKFKKYFDFEKEIQIQWIVRDRPAFEAAARIEKMVLKMQ
jgi:hypothetical protein